MLIFNYILVGVIGMILGYIVIPRVFGYGHTHGKLFFCHTDPDELDPTMIVELSEYPENISKRDYVIFKVSHK